MLKNLGRQKGLTLIEMMIAMVLGIFVIAVIITVFSTNVRTNVENMKMIRLNQELRGAMTFMADELKRSGYSAFPVTATFMADLNFSSGSPGCARYSYDENPTDGTQSASLERFGFKLDNSTIKWSKNAGDIGTLGSADCSNGSWESITDSNMAEITTLDFDVRGSINTDGVSWGNTAFIVTTGLSVYDVTITLTGTTDLPPNGADANDPRRTITETIRIRNEAPKD